MVESLMKAIAALGDHVEELERQIDIKEFALKREKEAREKAEAEVEALKKELEELKGIEIKKALEEKEWEDK